MLNVVNPTAAQRRLAAMITIGVLTCGVVGAYAATPHAPISLFAFSGRSTIDSKPLVSKPEKRISAGSEPAASSSPLPATRTRDAAFVRGMEAKPDDWTSLTEDQLKALRDPFLARYKTANPNVSDNGISVSALRDFLGEDWDDFVAIDDAYVAARRPRINAENLRRLQAMNAPFIIDVPDGVTLKEAARLAGLPDTTGYGIDLAYPSPHRLVMCNTPETPDTVQC